MIKGDNEDQSTSNHIKTERERIKDHVAFYFLLFFLFVLTFVGTG
jgi:hypothetical protein